MKQIFHLPRDECKSIYPKIKSNGDDLIFVAELANINNKNGTALALLILGAEEYAKAVVTMFHAYNINVFKIKEFQGVYKNHLRKHEVGILIELLNAIESITEYDDWNARRKIRKRKYNWIDRFVLNTIDFVKVVKPIAKIYMNTEWWNSANEKKNRGFYVDYKETLRLPSDFDCTDYDIAMPAVKSIVRNYRLINIAFHRASQKDKEEIIKIINEGIEDYINNETASNKTDD